ncbi:carbohydrate-binding module family 6 protein [Piromyces sp. E2]|nr:carbohydrate-binding module family 6 protein [Piromyces sp. E2]|eukprot:OUM68629.1 carbohydrate-binding module family 6 protein [Piromyces sp. E2]
MKNILFILCALVASTFVRADPFDDVVIATSYKNVTSHNPINVIKFTADPGVMVYDDTVYVYGTNDGHIQNLGETPEENNYSLIRSINVMSSKDLVNWVDHGALPTGDAAQWAIKTWAPAATHKTINGKEKFFLYFANGSKGIGVLTSDSPTGPFIDPIGDYLINHNTTNCEKVTWLFDPAVFIDDDGTGYLYFGGGVPGESSNAFDDYELYKDNPKYERPATLRAVKLGDDMISLASDPVVIDAPWLYEDSGMHKVDGVYYYTYCQNFKTPWAKARIGMMTSKSPLGPFEYVDTIFNNEGDWFGQYGNNHHTVIEFHGKWYIFYHSEWLNVQLYHDEMGYRTTHVDYLPYENGKFLNATGSFEGVKQLVNVNAFETQQASLMAWAAGVNTNGTGKTTVTYEKGEWTGVSQVDFEDGASAIKLVASSANGAVIKITIGEVNGEVIGYVTIPVSMEFQTVTAEILPVSGVKNVFFIASDEVTIDTWEFIKTNEDSEDEVIDVTANVAAMNDAEDSAEDSDNDPFF